jgi:hypothetical protein
MVETKTKYRNKSIILVDNRTIKKMKNLKEIIIAADLKTMLVNNIDRVYAIGYCEGDEYRDFYDPYCSHFLIFDFLKDILYRFIKGV